MPGRTTDATASSVQEQVTLHVPKILDQAQVSTTNHSKNLVALYKVQVEASRYTEIVKKGKGHRLVGERIFEDALHCMLLRVLPMRKGTTPADRVIKFIAGYVKFINEKAAEERSEEDEEDADNGTASRFTAHLLKFLLNGFLAKDKSVRYRSVQAVAEMISHLGEIDEEIYMDLRSGLLERINDKEGPVRMQAVIALSKLCGSEDPSEVEEGEQTILEFLVDILAHDTSPEVRRAALVNMPISNTTLPHILDRTRDTDTTLRKLVFATVLEQNVTQGETKLLGLTYPRVLSIAQRETIVSNGLGDRESSVRVAAASLLATWFDSLCDLDTKQEEVKQEGDQSDKVMGGVVAFLQLFDLLSPDKIKFPIDALISLFSTRADVFDCLTFADDFWADLTPEKALLARVFVDHCKANKDDARLEATLPVVTSLAFRIQQEYNNLTDDARDVEEESVLRTLSEEEKIRMEDRRIEREFMLGEMLRLAVNMDYSDEIGRRKMFQLVRDMLAQEELPESLLAKCLDVLRELSVNERDLIRVVVEIIQDLRDPGDDLDDPPNDVEAQPALEDTPATARRSRPPPPPKTPEEQRKADQIDLRCLSLTCGMLERVNGTLEENSSLDGILKGLIIPSVTRKDVVFRQKGLIALGLCCLIAEKFALSSVKLFFEQIATSPDNIRYSIIQVIFDMLMMHETTFFGPRGHENSMKIVNHLIGVLSSEVPDNIRALICIGVSKLLLAGMVQDEKILQNLVLAYLSPHTKDNQELRQCLTFFFPAFCYSSPSNQKRMREGFIGIFARLNTIRMDLEEDEEMVGPGQVGSMFVDWTDPGKVSQVFAAKGRVESKQQADHCIHVDLAIDIFTALLKNDDYRFEKEEKRALCQMLSKLHLPESVDDDKIISLKVLIDNQKLRRPLRDTVAEKMVNKFYDIITKTYEKQLEGLDEDGMRKLESLSNLFAFVDEIIPEDDDDENDVPKRKGRKRRSGSIQSAATTDVDSVVSNASSEKKPRSKAKRRRLTGSDNDSEVEEISPPPEREPRRVLPKRTAAMKKPEAPIFISSDSDEDQTTPFASKTRSRGGPKARVKQEEPDSRTNSHITEQSFDSIMDSSEEEDEVNDLLADE